MVTLGGSIYAILSLLSPCATAAEKSTPDLAVSPIAIEDAFTSPFTSSSTPSERVSRLIPTLPVFETKKRSDASGLILKVAPLTVVPIPTPVDGRVAVVVISIPAKV